MIELRAVSKTVTSGTEPLTILHPLTTTIARGQFVAIVGPSGSGKSTLLGLLAGLDAPTSGSVLIDGIDITALGEDALAKLRGEKIGFVFQFFHLIPSLTAHENVAVPMEITGAPNPVVRARSLLDEVGLTDRAHHYPSQLSGGEQQRVALARALANDPPIVLADEPTGNLDTKNGRHIMDLLRHSRGSQYDAHPRDARSGTGGDGRRAIVARFRCATAGWSDVHHPDGGARNEGLLEAPPVLLHLHRRWRCRHRGHAFRHSERPAGLRDRSQVADRGRRAHLDQPRLDTGGAIDDRASPAGVRRNGADRNRRDADHGAAGGYGAEVARMSELRAVEKAFPLYGTLTLQGGQTYAHAMLSNRGVLVRPNC